MEDRRQIAELLREAFLEGYEPEPGLAYRVMTGAMARRRHSRLWRLPLAAGAVVLTVLLVVTLVLARSHTLTSQTRPASLSSSAPRTAAAAPPPKGALPYVPIGPPPDQVHLVDWSGHELGPAFLLADGSSAMQVSPDGSLAIGGSGPVAVFDRQGMVVARGASFGTWSGDSQHGCALQAAGGQGLQLALSAIMANGIAVESTVSVPSRGLGGGPVSILACAVERGRVVVADGPAVALIDVVTGKTVRTVATRGLVNVSMDGRYLAQGAGYGTVSVTDLTTGVVVGRASGWLPGRGSAFSGDDGRLVLNSLDKGGGAGTWTVIDWRAGRVLAQAPGSVVLARSTPGSPYLGFDVATVDHWSGSLPLMRRDVVIVSDQGVAAVVERGVKGLE
jgi:hypothetical protein